MTDRLRNIPVHVWLLGLIVLGFALRLGAIDFQSLWRDEVDVIRLGDQLSSDVRAAVSGGGADALREALTGFNGPLYFLAMKPWLRLAGDTAFALRFPSALFGSLAIPLIYLLGRRLQRGKYVSLLAAWLVTLSPYFLWYSQEAKMYTEITTLALAAVYGLRRAVDTLPGQRVWHWWLLVALATTLAMYSHILIALLIGVEAILFLLWWPQSKRHLGGGLLTLAVLTLPYLPLAVWQIGLALTPGNQGFAFYRFDEILRIMVSGFTYGVLPFDYSLSAVGVTWQPGTFHPDLSPASWGVWLLGALVILGVLMWRDGRDRADRLALTAWMLFPVATIALISLNRPIFTDRYLIWIGPAVYLLAALGLAELWAWRRVLGGVALAGLTLVMATGGYAQSTTPFKSDFRSAAHYLEARYHGEPIVFQIPYGQYIFDYYFGPAFPIIEGPYTNARNPDGTYQYDAATFDAFIAGSLAGRETVWLVATEVEMWDDRFLLEGWLDQNAQVAERADFNRVTVVRYVFNR